MIEIIDKYQVHSGSVVIAVHETSFYMATWAVYEQVANGETRLLAGGTLEEHYTSEEEAMRIGNDYGIQVARSLAEKGGRDDPSP